MAAGGENTEGGWPAPLVWARRFLPEYFPDEPAAFHAELLADLADAGKRLLCRIAPRGHAKSTCAALAYPLWCICLGLRRNIVIVTHERSLARQFVRDLRHELETNERILEEYGDLTAPAAAKPASERRPGAKASQRARRPVAGQAETPAPPKAPATPRRKWTEELFITTTGIAVQAKSAGAAFRGVRIGPQRPDLIILDDIEHDRAVESASQRGKLEAWLRRVVMPALAPGGQLVVVGSLLHYDSLLANLRDRRKFPRWDYRVYRALEFARDEADGQFYPAPLWPARWPVEKLQEERTRVGTLAFEQEYQANPIDVSVRTFRPEWLRRYDERELAGRKLTTLLAVDPATGVEDGDYFAMWIGSMAHDTGVIYTRALTIERIHIVDQVQRIVAAFEKWRPARIGVEVTGYQVALQHLLVDEGRRRRLYLPLHAIRPQGSKIARIAGLAPVLEQGDFRFPANLDPDIEAQFLQHPKAAHDDAPDVCVMGLDMVRGMRGAGTIEIATGRGNGRGGREW